jgi:RNA polymerase sigma-70 factor (ECF subfamily)
MTAQDRVIRAYEEGRQDVYRYLLRLGVNPAQAQEATQEVFLRLFVALRKGEEIRNVRAWMFRVAHNLGMNVHADRNHWQALEEPLKEEVADGAPGPETRAIEKQRMEVLNRAVDGLSPQQRQCLHLRAEGLRYHEIAATIGIGVSTVGEFLSRAITRLRGAVNDEA